MKYHYLKIQSHRAQKEMVIQSTDAATLEQVAGHLKEQGASASSREVNGRIFSLTVRGLGKNDEGVSFAVMGLLGRQG